MGNKNQNKADSANKRQKEIFVSNLKRYLEEKDKLQKDIAVELGISQCSITDWVKMRTYPRMDKLQKLANYFNCEISDLIEERSIDNKYYLKKTIKEVTGDLENDPQSVVLFQKIKKLSESDKKIVEALIDSLGGK